MSLAPASAPGMRVLFSINDKVEHALGYFFLTLFFCGIYPRRRYVWIVLGLFAMGVSVELLQGWMAMGRQRDIKDVVANTAGIVAGVALALTFLHDWIARAERYVTRRDNS